MSEFQKKPEIELYKGMRYSKWKKYLERKEKKNGALYYRNLY